MGALVNLFDVVALGDRGEPSARVALLRVASALAQTEGEIEAILVGRQKLEAELGVVAEARQELQNRIDAEKTSLLEKMRRGVDWTLSQFGSVSTLNFAARLSASTLQAEIGQLTLEEAAQELQRLEAKAEQLREARAGIIKETIREAIEPALLEEWAETLTQLRAGLTRLTALRRFLEPQSHDWRPDAARLAIELPDFANGRDQTAIVATAKSIAQVEAALNAFAEALEKDPKSPCPELEVDASEDPSTPYHELSTSERAAVDRDFVPPVNNHRRTIDAELFETQLAEAKALVGLTN